MSKVARRFVLCALVVGAGSSVHATHLRGKVLNGTTGTSSAGDTVVLLVLSQDGMSEIARTQTDSMGRFVLEMKDAANHLVRVIHQGVTYHKPVESELKALVAQVYDVAESLEGVSAVMDVQRFEATADTLEIKQLITIRNQSKPPRTIVNDRPFEIHLPLVAHVVSGMIQIETGQPLKQKPIRGEHQGQYYFSSPIRPGDTRFAVVYQLPYKGETLIEPTVRNPSERFVVMLPRSMTFEPAIAGMFRPMPGSSSDNAQGTAPVSPDQNVAFRISGTGTLEEFAGRRQQAQQSLSDPKARPGGGLGAPIDAPDPLQKRRWVILVGITLLIVTGARYAMRRDRSPSPRRRGMLRKRGKNVGGRIFGKRTSIKSLNNNCAS